MFRNLHGDESDDDNDDDKNDEEEQEDNDDGVDDQDEEDDDDENEEGDNDDNDGDDDDGDDDDDDDDDIDDDDQDDNIDEGGRDGISLRHRKPDTKRNIRKQTTNNVLWRCGKNDSIEKKTAFFCTNPSLLSKTKQTKSPCG